MNPLLSASVIVLFFVVAGSYAEKQPDEHNSEVVQASLRSGSKVTVRPAGVAIASPGRTNITPSPVVGGDEALLIGTGDGSAGAWTRP